jgi:hypothetical protein
MEGNPYQPPVSNDKAGSPGTASRAHRGSTSRWLAIAAIGTAILSLVAFLSYGRFASEAMMAVASKGPTEDLVRSAERSHLAQLVLAIGALCISAASLATRPPLQRISPLLFGSLGLALVAFLLSLVLV